MLCCLRRRERDVGGRRKTPRMQREMVTMIRLHCAEKECLKTKQSSTRYRAYVMLLIAALFSLLLCVYRFRVL